MAAAAAALLSRANEESYVITDVITTILMILGATGDIRAAHLNEYPMSCHYYIIDHGS